jgi:hypothetical protein
MSPRRTFLSIAAVFVLLGFLSLIFPRDGIQIGSHTLRFPSLLEKIQEAKAEHKDTLKIDPEEQIKKMLAETRAREFAEYADSLNFYEKFFREGPTRFDFPENDPSWFDRFFQQIQEAKDSGKVVHIVHYGDSQLEGDRITAAVREPLQALWGGYGPGMVSPLADIPSYVLNSHSVGNLSRHRIFGPVEEIAGIHLQAGLVREHFYASAGERVPHTAGHLHSPSGIQAPVVVIPRAYPFP